MNNLGYTDITNLKGRLIGLSDMYLYDSYIPNAFDESLTMVEKINKLNEILNTVVKLCNDLNISYIELVENWEKVRQWVLSDGMKNSMLEILNQWYADGTLAKIINENVFSLINKKIEERIIHVTDVTAMKDYDAKPGELFYTLGYKSAGDGGRAYFIVGSNKPVNDVNIIQLKNGNKAELFIDGGVEPIHFGITGAEEEKESIRRWDAYTDYVNTNDDCYFYITHPANKFYRIYKPIIARKSFIGEKTRITPAFMYMTSKTSKKVVSETETTSITAMSLNVKAIITLLTKNDGNRYEIGNFTVTCTDVEDYLFGMDYGVYVPETPRVHIHDIRVNKAKRTGVYVGSTWVSTIERIEVFDCGYRGFVMGHQDVDGGITKTGTSTSVTVSSIYVNMSVHTAYYFYGLQYSTLNNLACDNTKNASIIYGFELCKGITVNSPGMEKCSANTLDAVNGCGGLIFNTPYFLNVAYGVSIIAVRNPVERFNGVVSINNPSFIDGLTGMNGVTPKQTYMFDTDYLVTITCESTKHIINDTTVDIMFGNRQKNFYEFSSDYTRKLVNGRWEYMMTNDNRNFTAFGKTDITSEATSVSTVRNLKVIKKGDIIKVSAIVDVKAGWNTNIISLNKPLFMGTAIEVHNGDGIKAANNLSGGFDNSGNLTVLSETDAQNVSISAIVYI